MTADKDYGPDHRSDCVLATAISNLAARPASCSKRMRTVIISHIFFAVSVADLKFSPTTGTAYTTGPGRSSAVMT
jgi:hypothetical protein